MHSRPSLRVLVALLVPLAGATGCATTSNPTPEANGVTSRSVEVNGTVVETNDIATGQVIHVRGTPVAAMSALAQIYSDLKIPIGTMVTTTGQIGNNNYNVPSHRLGTKWLSDYLNCGQEQASGARADAADVTISVMSKAVAVGDTASDVTTNVAGWARSIGSSTNIVPCQTTGALEHDINLRLALAMAKGA
jgi:hypothetical protein